VVALFCAAATLTIAVPANAANHPSSVTRNQSQTAVDWNTHDTAVYVVSTVNLLRTRSGRVMLPVLRHRLGVRRYNVYSDATASDMYYIDLLKSDGTVAGTLAYRMGWQKPMSLSSALDSLGVTHASDSVVAGYKSDKKTLIGSFSSTLPQ
jgi:hypothetical protein